MRRRTRMRIRPGPIATMQVHFQTRHEARIIISWPLTFVFHNWISEETVELVTVSITKRCKTNRPVCTYS